MAKSSDTGHSKNVSNFLLLVNVVKGMGSKYNPTNPRLKTEALDAQYIAAKTANDAVGTAESPYNRAVSERQDAFKDLKKLTTRIYNTFLTTDAPQGVKDRVKSLADKIRGVTKPSKTPPSTPPAAGETNEDRTHSVSQQSFDMIAENFNLLLGTLQSEPTYEPAEHDLQTATLETLYNDLMRKNETAASTFQPLHNARGTRNQLLYQETTGLVDTAIDGVKRVVSGAFGPSSSEYKLISGLKFTRVSL